MFDKRSILPTYIRLYINNAFLFVMVNTVTIIIKSLSNRYFDKGFIIDYTMLSLKYILLFSFLTSLMMLGSSKYITKAVRIDEKSIDEGRIMDAMERMKWKALDHADEGLTFVSPFSLGIFREEIFARFVETEIHITGPGRYVEEMLRYAKFPYASYEILAKE